MTESITSAMADANAETASRALARRVTVGTVALVPDVTAKPNRSVARCTSMTSLILLLLGAMVPGVLTLFRADG